MRWRWLFLGLVLSLYGAISIVNSLKDLGRELEKKGDYAGAVKVYGELLYIMDSLKIVREDEFIEVFERVIDISSSQKMSIDFDGTAIKKDKLFDAFVCAYKSEKYLLALFRLELYISSFGFRKELLPFRAYLWEQVGANKRAEKYYKESLKFNKNDNLFYYAGFLRRTGRFESAIDILEHEIKKERKGVILNELALTYFLYAQSTGGKGEYYKRAFEYFARACGCTSEVNTAQDGKGVYEFGYSYSGPSSDGRYKFGISISKFGGNPSIIKSLSIKANYPDGSKNVIYYAGIEKIVELFGTAYIAPGCTIRTIDSAFSVDFDIERDESLTCFPSRSPFLRIEIELFNKDLSKEDVLSDSWVNLNSNYVRLDTIIGKAYRKAGREDTLSTLKAFLSILNDSLDYPCFISKMWREYLSLWFKLESPQNCNENLIKVDSLLHIYPSEKNLLLMRSAFLFLCERYDEAEELLKMFVQLDPNNKWAYYNLGIIAYIKGDTPGAFSNFKKVIQIDSGFSDAYLNIGIILEEMGQEKTALYYYEKYLSLGGVRNKEVKQWIEIIKSRSF
ncbi:MAG: tetratricopeptide repeat protein [bacterium]